jgi:hypothetical protein
VIADPPSWAEVHHAAHTYDASVEQPDAGEQDALLAVIRSGFSRRPERFAMRCRNIGP